MQLASTFTLAGIKIHVQTAGGISEFLSKFPLSAKEVPQFY